VLAGGTTATKINIFDDKVKSAATIVTHAANPPID
jgi:hypothetical protein